MTAAARIGALTAGFILSLGLGATASAHVVHSSARAAWQHYGRHARFLARSGHSGGHLQCVPFARMDSGIELTGIARDWWENAAGVYQRGSRPEPGSVLSFQPNGIMRLGHVAVVKDVIDGRTVTIDQANWSGPGRITRDVTVVDVSTNNDWSAVRVGLEHSGDFGSIYPTDGFIYNRPDNGTIVASAATGTPLPLLNPAPRDLRNPGLDTASFDEVAEAPDPAESHWHRHVSYAQEHRHVWGAQWQHHSWSLQWHRHGWASQYHRPVSYTRLRHAGHHAHHSL